MFRTKLDYSHVFFHSFSIFSMTIWPGLVIPPVEVHEAVLASLDLFVHLLGVLLKLLEKMKDVEHSTKLLQRMWIWMNTQCRVSTSLPTIQYLMNNVKDSTYTRPSSPNTINSKHGLPATKNRKHNNNNDGEGGALSSEWLGALFLLRVDQAAQCIETPL